MLDLEIFIANDEQMFRMFLNLLQFSVEFHIGTNHLVCSENQMNGFYVKRNTGLKWVKQANTCLKSTIKTLGQLPWELS